MQERRLRFGGSKIEMPRPTDESTASNILNLLQKVSEQVDFKPDTKKSQIYPIAILAEAKFMSQYKMFGTRKENSLGKKISRYEDPLERILTALRYQAQPLLKGTKYQEANDSYIQDAYENAGIDIEEYPHRSTVELNAIEFIVFRKLCEKSGIPFDPNNRKFSLADLYSQLKFRQTDQATH